MRRIRTLLLSIGCALAATAVAQDNKWGQYAVAGGMQRFRHAFSSAGYQLTLEYGRHWQCPVYLNAQVGFSGCNGSKAMPGDLAVKYKDKLEESGYRWLSTPDDDGKRLLASLRLGFRTDRFRWSKPLSKYQTRQD